MEIFYGCVYKRSTKTVINGSRVESIVDARKEHKKIIRRRFEEDCYLQKLLIICSFVEICFYRNKFFFIMQISFLAKVFLFLALYCISDMSIKNNIIRKVMSKANRARRV